MSGPTQFDELNSVLAGLTASVREILGDTFVGAYVQGSFALGAGDIDSDCDVIVATTVPPGGPIERELRWLHDEIPVRDGFWTKELELSYADVGSLRGVDGIGVPWLYCDRGHRQLIWHTHCNSLHTRWILRHHGIVLAGPPSASLVDEVPERAMRDSMREALPGTLEGIGTWAPFDIAWTQRYIVATYCRMLYTLWTARVTSKAGALQWAREELDPRWRPLLEQVIADRALGWNPADPPKAGSMQAAREFAAYVEALALSLPSS